MLPDFHLPAPKGDIVSPRDYRGRRNLVVAFLGELPCGPCSRFLTDVADRYDELRAEEAEVLAVARAGVSVTREAGAALPFPLLADEAGHVHSRYGAGPSHAAIYIADRFGDVFAVYHLTPADLPPATALLEWLRFIEVQCPE